MELDLLKQEIEFLQFQLEDCKTREIQQKTIYESMLRSLNSQTDFNSFEEIEKYKAVINELQIKQEEFMNTENLLNTQLELLQESTSEMIIELKSKNFKLTSEKQALERMMEDKDKEIKELEWFKSENFLLVQKNEQLEKLLEQQKIDLVKRQECIIEDLEFLHQSKVTNLNTLIESLYRRLAENAQIDIKNEIKSLISPSQLTKTAQVLKSIDKIKTLTDAICISEVQQALNSLLSLYEDLSSDTQTPIAKHNRSYTFAPSENSPISKENDSETYHKRLETIFTFSVAFLCEFCNHLVNKPKYYEHLLECINEKPLRIGSRSEVLYEAEGIGKMEEQINSLKLTIGKLKHQRDTARIAADKMLSSLKQAKLELAISEEQAGQRIMELKLEIKSLANFLLVLRSNLHFPINFSQEVDKVVDRTTKIFGGRICIQ